MQPLVTLHAGLPLEKVLAFCRQLAELALSQKEAHAAKPREAPERAAAEGDGAAAGATAEVSRRSSLETSCQGLALGSAPP